jgi:hypothetical protein
MGVNIDVVNIATTEDREKSSAAAIEATRRRYSARRKMLGKAARPWSQRFVTLAP